jgi:radical SAM superfamily enzyme YgiQ (UPF0313 family)
VKVGLVAVPIVDGPGALGPEGAGAPEPTVSDDVGSDLFEASLRPVGADVVRPCPPYAVYLLAGVLRSAGHEVVIVDLIADGSGRLEPRGLDDVDLVGVTATSLSWAAARVAIAHVRRSRPDVPIVVGGVHASQFDQWVLDHSHADMVIRGDGELPLLALCDALEHRRDLATVPSLSWHGDGGVFVRNAMGPKVDAADLTRWMPDYRSLPHRAYWGLALETARGCTFDCAFCSTPHRRRWRSGDPPAVVDRLERLVGDLERTITSSVYLVDDEFSLNPARAMAIGEGLTEREVPLRLLFDSRAPDVLHPGLLDALAPHTQSLLIGAECGYDAGLARIGKGTTTAVLRQAAAALAGAGIAGRADFSFILGLPWEGPEEVRRTVDFGFELARDHGVRLLFNWYAQIPGSHLWDEARAHHAIHESRYDTFGVQRDPSVFFAAVKLTEDEIDRLARRVDALRTELGGGAPRPEFALPPAIIARRLGEPQPQAASG